MTSAPPETILDAELLEFDLDAILEYAAMEASLKKKKKPAETEPEAPPNAFTVMERTLLMRMKSPVALRAAVLAQYAENGLESVSRDVFRYSTSLFEAKAGVIDLPLLQIFNRQRGNVKRRVLLSANVISEAARPAVFEELRFLASKVKKCKNHFVVTEMLWALELNRRSSMVTMTLRYKLDLRPLFFRYFSSDVTQPLLEILKPHVEPYPMSLDAFAAEFSNLPIDTHLFYKVITDNTARMPAPKETFHHPHLLTELLPFQRRSVEWLLLKESAKYDPQLRTCLLVPLISDKMGQALRDFPNTDTDWLDEEMHRVLGKICYGWKRVFFKGDVCWLNAYTGNIFLEEQLVSFLLQYYNESNAEPLPGKGLLSEEMGLGKTVEIMDLILLNPRAESEVGQDISLQFKEEGDFRLVKKAKTTLIAAPDSILRQWYSEISQLCPSLLVTIYRGLGKYPDLANVPKYIAEYLQRFDVVLMNYYTMSKETDYANYSSRHVPTRGGQKRTNGSDQNGKEEPKEDTPSSLVDQFKTEFLTNNPTPSDLNFSQKKYDRAVLEEIAAKVRREDPTSIPHTHFYESPLMLCQWWRVVLDEVQMVSSGANRAFVTASLIPRFHSWGVSGTPVRLLGVLQFLKFAPFSYDIKKYCWKLLTSGEAGNEDFVNIWLNLSLRHTKAMVHDDIKLPPQQRILLTIPFTKVEQDKYNEIYESTLASIGLYADKIPPPEDVAFSASAYVHLRTWLVKLRQLCGNLQIGRLPRAQATRGRNKNKFLLNGIPELKTLENVLDDMIDSVIDDISEAEKGIINKLLEMCLLLEYTLYPEKVIEILNVMLVEILKLIARVTAKSQKEFQEYQKVRDFLNEQGALARKDMEDISDDEEFEMDDDEMDEKVEDDVKEEDIKSDVTPVVDEARIQESLTKFPKLKEAVASNRMRLRSWKMTQHKCYFLLASAHFQLYDQEYQEKIKKLRIPFDTLSEIHQKVQMSGLLTTEEVSLFTGFEPSGDINIDYLAQFTPADGLSEQELNTERNKHLETTYYDLAEQCRKEILRHPIKDVATVTAKRLTDRSAIEDGDWVNDGRKVLPKTSKKLFTYIPLIELEDIRDLTSDMKSRHLVEQFLKLVTQLNNQALVLNENAKHLMTVLTNPLLSTEKTPDGEEYEQSIEDQDRASCLMLVMSQMLMDRSNATLEQKTKITEISQIAKQQEQDFKFEAQRVSDKKFLKDLQNNRVKVKPSSNLSLEELLQDARLLEVELRDNYRLNTNIEVFKEMAQLMRNAFESEKNCQSILQKELNTSFNAVFNSRVEYFKQLQQISDSVQNKSFDFSQEEFVAPVLDAEFHLIFYQLTAARNKLTRSMSRWRYLATLVPKESEVKKELQDDLLEEVICIICQLPITVGSLTSCGHRFCKACLDEWLAGHSSCPICKSYADKESVYYFTHYKADLKAQAVANGHEEREASSQSKDDVHQIYKQLDSETLRKIQRINLSNTYGSKVDLIVKQVQYLRNLEPDVQIVIFSQWQDLLIILAFAFDKAGISYVLAKGSRVAAYKNRKTDPVEEFKNQHNVKTCFLLNAQAQALGLTLINATHIFLCEPLVNTPTELQAISRIHRIGQKKVTTVWMFAIENTVEENIVALGTRKRLEYLKANARENEAASRLLLAAPGPMRDSDIRTAELFALTTTADRVFAGNSESVNDGDLYNVYFGSDARPEAQN